MLLQPSSAAAKRTTDVAADLVGVAAHTYYCFVAAVAYEMVVLVAVAEEEAVAGID